MINYKPQSSIALWFTLVCLTFVFSFLIYISNELWVGYPGNNYFPGNTIIFALFCFLCLIGSYLLEKETGSTRLFGIATELCLFFMTMVTITVATNAVQLTPFPLVDPTIIAIESKCSFSLTKAMAWLFQYPNAVYLLTTAYASLTLQMAIIPLLLMLYMYFQPEKAKLRLRRYYCLMLMTTIVGFAIYYFFPTAAPAAFMQSPFFTWEQYATGIKLLQIRHYIQPDTLAGGLIALPSFHTIWAILCLYLVFPIKPAFYLLLINNLLLIVACIFLGWHYPTDIIAAFAIVGLSFRLVPRQH